MTLYEVNLVLKGGRGSGNFRHSGRPGKRGGSGGSSKVNFSRSKTKISSDVKKYDIDRNIRNLEADINNYHAELNELNDDVVSKVVKNSGVDEPTVRKFMLAWNIEGPPSQRFTVALAVNQAIGGSLSPYEEKHKDKWMKEANVSPEVASKYRKIAKSMYDDTQRNLEELGSSEVMLYRGLSTDSPSGHKKGDIVKHHGNSVESWTTDRDLADEYATGTEHGILLKTAIPAKKIFSMPSTGAGTSIESEFLVLGNGPNNRVMITDASEAIQKPPKLKKKTVKKPKKKKERAIKPKDVKRHTPGKHINFAFDFLNTFEFLDFSKPTKANVTNLRDGLDKLRADKSVPSNVIDAYEEGINEIERKV